MDTYAIWAGTAPDEYILLIKELMLYDVQCDSCNVLERHEKGCLLQANPPSPLHWSRQVEWPWAINEAKLDHKHFCLDIGSGWSVLKYAIAKRCRSLHCVDYDEESVIAAEKTNQKIGASNISCFKGDARDLKYCISEMYDRVFCISVIEHIPDGHLQCVKEAVRALRPGGVLLLTMDLIVDGKKGGKHNFHIDQEEANQIVRYLGIEKVQGTEKALATKIEHDGVTIMVLMIRYVKPL